MAPKVAEAKPKPKAKSRGHPSSQSPLNEPTVQEIPQHVLDNLNLLTAENIHQIHQVHYQRLLNMAAEGPPNPELEMEWQETGSQEDLYDWGEDQG